MARSPEQFAQGQLIPGTKYRTRSMIGSGGMGSVYEVEHIELGKLFVLKALRAGLVERTDLAARMKNEWRALGRLQHPNIVVVTDAGSTDEGVPYFVMERLEGETLASRMRRDVRLSVPLALRISVGLLDALAAAHAISVVHRDIKPQNVFLPASGGVKLLDFGIAKLQDRDREAHVVTVRGVAIGTPRYMSPEQAEGKTVDGRADIYSMALVLFEMIAGKGPFPHRRDPNELVLAHMSETPARLDVDGDVPSELADLVHRWLSKSPDDRPRDAHVAAAELRSLLGRYTFDRSHAADPSNEPTAHADYEASTQAGAASPKAPLEARRGKTLSLGTAPLAVDESVTRADQVTRVDRPRGGQLGPHEAPPFEGGHQEAPEEASQTLVLTGTMTPPDAPTTRTVSPELGKAKAASEPAPRKAPRNRARVSEEREPPSSSETPQPIEPRDGVPERAWPRMVAVAAIAAALSFGASVLLGTQPAPSERAASEPTARIFAEKAERRATSLPSAPEPPAASSAVLVPAPSASAATAALPAPSCLPSAAPQVQAAPPRSALEANLAQTAGPAAATAAKAKPTPVKTAPSSVAKSAAAKKSAAKPSALNGLPQSGL
jgi:serine/threonine-protein kinase